MLVSFIYDVLWAVFVYTLELFMIWHKWKYLLIINSNLKNKFYFVLQYQKSKYLINTEKICDILKQSC